MLQFILRSVVAIFLSCSALHATEAMAKNTGMRCNQCHKGRNPILGVMPKLKSKGVRHLVKLITVEGYIPKYNYSKLNYLAATIEANRKKLEGPKKVKEQVSSSADETIVGAKPNVSDQNRVDKSNIKNKSPEPMKDSNKLTQETASFSNTVRSESNRNVSEIAKKDLSKAVVNNLQSKSNSAKPTKSTQKVVTHTEGKVKFKGGKTFILKRPKVKPGTKYDWEQDWSFDDYY